MSHLTNFVHHVNPQVLLLRSQLNEREITEKYLQKQYNCGILSDTELEFIKMTDAKILDLYKPYEEGGEKNGYPKWKFYEKDNRFVIKLPGKDLRKRHWEDFKKALLAYHMEQFEVKHVPTVSESFERYIKEREDMCYIKAYATEKKYKTDFKRFFENDEEHFVDRKIDSVTKEDISSFFRRTIERLGLNRKAFSALYNYTRGMFESCYDDGMIPNNPCGRVKKETFYSLCHEKDITEACSGKIATKEDIKRILDKIEKTKRERPWDLVPYAYQLCVFYGMRPSEACGLKWSDLSKAVDGKEVICIQRRSVEDLKEGKDNTLIRNPKGNKTRLIPVTDNIKHLLDEVIAVKKQFGIESEWIFGIGDKPMCPNKLGNYGRDRKGGKNHLTPYKMRRTINSILKEMYSLTTEQTSALLGNSVQVNNRHYTYETGFMGIKADALKKVQEDMLSLRDDKVNDEKEDTDENNSLSER